MFEQEALRHAFLGQDSGASFELEIQVAVDSHHPHPISVIQSPQFFTLEHPMKFEAEFEEEEIGFPRRRSPEAREILSIVSSAICCNFCTTERSSPLSLETTGTLLLTVTVIRIGRCEKEMVQRIRRTATFREIVFEKLNETKTKKTYPEEVKVHKSLCTFLHSI